jgi:hypothetical protein
MWDPMGKDTTDVLILTCHYCILAYYLAQGLMMDSLIIPKHVGRTSERKYMMCLTESGPGSVVGIVTGYGLDGPGIESRWGSRFFAPVHSGPGTYPASCTMGTRSFLR